MEENTNASIFDEMALQHPNFEDATTGQRFLNYLIDMLIFYMLNIAIFFVLGVCLGLAGNDEYEIAAMFSSKLLRYCISYLDLVIIFTCVEGITKGRSLGKLITGTQAVTYDIERITWKHAFQRSLCRIIPFEPISGLGGNPWHDSITKTRVVRKLQQPL